MNYFFFNVSLILLFLKKNILWIVVSVFLLTSMMLYFVVTNRYILSTENIAFFDQSTEIEKVYDAISWPENKIRIIYFWQAYCPCDATVMPHFKELYKEHAENDIEFYLADISSESLVHDRPFDNMLSEKLTNLFRPFVSHTPSVAIWNEQGELTYFGPHSLGYVCNAETSFVKKVIDSLLQKIQSKNTNIVGSGCFCKV